MSIEEKIKDGEAFSIAYIDANGYVRNDLICETEKEAVARIKELTDKDKIPFGHIIVHNKGKFYWGIKGDKREWQEIKFY